MSPYEPVAIVPQNAITRGRWLRRFWFTGWALAVLSLTGSAFLSGQVLAYKDSAKELEHARKEIKALQAEQNDLATKFSVAWEDQRKGLNLVTSWASYIKDRDDIGSFNRQNGPTSVKNSVAAKDKH